jgi:ferritin-like protein
VQSLSANAYAATRSRLLSREARTGLSWRGVFLPLEMHMGFDFDRSEVDSDIPREADAGAPISPNQSPKNPNQSDVDLVKQALTRNLVAEHFAINAYRQMAALGDKYDKATLRLVKVALAIEEEHAAILSTLIEDLAHVRRFG